MEGTKICVLLSIVLHCDGVSIAEQLAHIARRFSDGSAVILGVPKYPSHLPAAEPILPGHTLIRPAMGMLKSSVKFPHREQEAGSGVYGHVDNLGIKFGGRNERVLYSGFRRVMPKTAKNYALMPRYVARMPADATWENTDTVWERSQEQKESLELKYETENLLNKLTKKGIIKKNIRINYEPLKRKKKKSKNRNKFGFKDYLRLIRSLRRDEKVRKEVPNSPFRTRVGLDGFVIAQDSESEGARTKRKTFWETKDTFNHIKINPEAPEHMDLLPSDAFENIPNWWYYQQSDFEEFVNR